MLLYLWHKFYAYIPFCCMTYSYGNYYIYYILLYYVLVILIIFVSYYWQNRLVLLYEKLLQSFQNVIMNVKYMFFINNNQFNNSLKSITFCIILPVFYKYLFGLVYKCKTFRFVVLQILCIKHVWQYKFTGWVINWSTFVVNCNCNSNKN